MSDPRKVVVLGGCGAVGRMAVKTLAAHEAFSHVVIADINRAGAEELAREMGSDDISVLEVDAGDVASVAEAIRGVDVVVNCSGPFYKFVKPTLQAVLQERVPYVDVCDDVDVTQEILQLDGQAKEAGVCAVIGMGNSPGVTNLIARFIVENLLDEAETVDIYHAHGGEPFEGEGVIAHRFHGMSIDVPMFLDGELKTVRFHEPDGIALRERVDFHLLGTDIPVYPYPHPEQVTLPNYLDVKQVTNRGTVLPDEYFQLTVELSRLGFASKEPLTAGGVEVAPFDVAVAFLKKRRDEILAEVEFGSQRGCTKVVVRGMRRGEPREYRFSMASVEQALGEGTGIPAAMGAILMAEGLVRGTGVLPPEGCINPIDFLALVRPVLDLLPSGKSFEGFLVEQVDAQGNVQTVDLPF